MKLVIVESPTKAKTIQRFLDKSYKVKASYGHIRDLPKKKLGVDVENNFEPEYIISQGAEARIEELKKISDGAELVILAADEDREGEAIAWHLVQALQLGKSEIRNPKSETNPKFSPSSQMGLRRTSKIQNSKLYRRIVFHEITKPAIEKALKNPRDINMNLVDAQQARRVLDRLVGYELSPFLWKKIRYGLSAGRVQSVAVRLIIEREEEIRKFRKEEYWNIAVNLRKILNNKLQGKISNSPPAVPSAQPMRAGKFPARQNLQLQALAGGQIPNKSQVQNSKLQTEFEVKLVKIDNETIPKLGIKTKEKAREIKKELEKASYKVEKVTKKELKKNPLPPFTTSTLQQAANNRLGYSAKQTMMIAQQLYEGIRLNSKNSIGLITYMRTDSLNLSEESLKLAENYIKNKFGREYSNKRVFKTKSKSAQEAHEAIRPSDPSRDPESVKNYLDNRQYKIYQLIWQRMVASQMASAISDLTTIDVLAKHTPNPSQEGNNMIYILRATGSVIKFEGFLKVYPIKSEDVILPEVKENERLDLIKVISSQHFTQPPARYTEAGLVKKMEEEGIGRPSTYAPTLSTIQERGYVEKIERKFHPKEIGELVNKLLVEHFSKIVNFKFTAEMEENLDKIAEGKVKWDFVIKEFYQPFKKNLTQKEKEINKKDLTEETTNEKCEKCGAKMIIKLGRFGKFLACGNYPKCKNTKQINDQGKPEEPETTNEKCEKCGAAMVVKHGRFGKFLGCSNYPECRNIKPIVKSTGVKCPECGKGEIVEKKSKKGRIFYACNQYPKCEFALWNKPTGKKCPKCGSLLIYASKEKARCSSKECGYEELIK